MTALEVLSELRRRGVEVEAAGDRLRFRPGDAVDARLREAMRRHKPEIVRLVSGRRLLDDADLCVLADRLRPADLPAAWRRWCDSLTAEYERRGWHREHAEAIAWRAVSFAWIQKLTR